MRIIYEMHLNSVWSIASSRQLLGTSNPSIEVITPTLSATAQLRCSVNCVINKLCFFVWQQHKMRFQLTLEFYDHKNTNWEPWISVSSSCPTTKPYLPYYSAYYGNSFTFDTHEYSEVRHIKWFWLQSIPNTWPSDTTSFCVNPVKNNSKVLTQESTNEKKNVNFWFSRFSCFAGISFSNVSMYFGIFKIFRQQ